MDEAQADPAITFIVTFGHRPAYSSGHHAGEPELKADLDALGDTHSKYVLNLNGHSHDYERTYPQHGVTHITAGTGGSTLESEVGPCPWAGGCPAPSFTAFRAMHHAAFQLTFTATTIQGQALCGPSAPENDVSCTPGSVLDSFMIGDLPPVVTAPASAGVAEEQTLTINVSAADPNGDAINSLVASNLPAGATFTPGPGNLTGTLSWTPASDQSGTHTVTFTASNALSASSSTVISVSDVDHAPVVVAPATAGGPAQVPMTFSVTATDPDGEALTSLIATGLPTGAKFTPGPGNTSGTFTWTPEASQSGAHLVTFTAANALSGSSSTAITVSSVDRAPVVSAPAAANATPGALLTVEVAASDADGDAIASLIASGLPAGATFTSDAAQTSGTLSWTPSAAQAGSHTVTFTASNALSGSRTTSIVVIGADLAPVVNAPATASAKAGTSITVNVTATDPNGDAIGSLTASARPGAVFTTSGNNTSGSFTWTPTTADQGDHAIAFTASNALSGSDTTVITVLPPNQVPVPALTVTPANGNAPLVVVANATGSVDNDGSIVSYRFDFGDGVVTAPQPSPIAPSHTYAVGNWNLAVQVTDNEGGVGTRLVQVIVAAVPASPNLVGNPSFEVGTTGWGVYSAGAIARVAGGFDGGWALQMTGGATTSSFGVNDSPNWVTNVPAPGNTYRFSAWVRSATHTGVAKLQVREYLGTTKVGALYSNGVTLSPNWQLVTVDYLTVAGGSSLDFQVLDAPTVASEVFLTDNISIRNVTAAQPASAGRGGDPALVGGADSELGVNLSSMTLRGTLAPSPIHSSSTLSFATSRPGPLTVEVFEITGRRVRVLLDEPFAQAGLHQVSVDLRDGRAGRLSAGMYFYVVRAAEGRSTGRFVFAP
jgi:hypothetical protein